MEKIAMTTMIREIGVEGSVMTVVKICAEPWANGWNELVKCVNVPKSIHEVEAMTVVVMRKRIVDDGDGTVMIALIVERKCEKHGKNE